MGSGKHGTHYCRCTNKSTNKHYNERGNDSSKLLLEMYADKPTELARTINDPWGSNVLLDNRKESFKANQVPGHSISDVKDFSGYQW